MMLAAALIVLFQTTPLPTASAPPAPAASADSDALPPDCDRYEDDGRACASDPRKGIAESACVRAAEHQLRCAQHTTGSVHYEALMRAGSYWGLAGAWLGHRTPHGHVYFDKARHIYVQLASDPNAPGTIAAEARATLRGLYGTDRPTSSTPLLIDRRRS